MANIVIYMFLGGVVILAFAFFGLIFEFFRRSDPREDEK